MNEFYKKILSRRTTRAYTDEGVDLARLNLIAEAGLCAPSAMNQQAWEIAIVTDKKILKELNSAVQKTLPETAVARIKSRLGDKDFSFFYNAPALIIVAIKDEAIFPQCDCGCAITNMYHAACSLDLGACWINQISGNVSKEPSIQSILNEIGISNDMTVYGCLAVGNAAAHPTEKTIKGKIIVK